MVLPKKINSLLSAVGLHVDGSLDPHKALGVPSVGYGQGVT